MNKLLLILPCILLLSCFQQKHLYLFDAVEYNKIEELQSIDWENTNINSVMDSRGRTLLYTAALYGYIDAVKFLLSQGADQTIGASWKDMATPLHVASAQGHTEVVRYLLENGGDPNCVTLHGITPLHTAARHRKPEAVNVLLTFGSNIHAIDKYGKSVLHGYDWSTDINKKLTDTVNILLDNGAEVNSLSKDGNTPLMEFCIIGSSEVVELLIKRGAKVNMKNNNGLHAIDFAKTYKHNDIVELLSNYL